MVAAPLLDNPRSLMAKVAAVLGGTAIERPRLSGFLNSEVDPFLNQLVAAGPVTPRAAAEALEGRPGFVWLAEEPSPSEIGAAGAVSPLLVVMHGMTAATAGPAAVPEIHGKIVEVRSRSELRAWHEVYCEVFGGDDRGSQDWQRVHDALGPSGDRSLLLLLATIDGLPAAMAVSISSRTSPASTASRRASGCAAVASRPHSCMPPMWPRKRAASSGRSYKRRHRAGRSTPGPDTGSSGHSRFSSPG
jgi:hypothetical protein